MAKSIWRCCSTRARSAPACRKALSASTISVFSATTCLRNKRRLKRRAESFFLIPASRRTTVSNASSKIPTALSSTSTGKAGNSRGARSRTPSAVCGRRRVARAQGNPSGKKRRSRKDPEPVRWVERSPLPANCDSRNSVPVVAQRGQLRGPFIAAIAKKVIAALNTAERPRLAMFNAEVEPQTIRLGRMCALAGGGRMVRLRIVEVIVAVCIGRNHLLTKCPPGGGRRSDDGRRDHGNRSEPKPHQSNHDDPHIGAPEAPFAG